MTIRPSHLRELKRSANHMIRMAVGERLNTHFRHLVEQYGFATALIKFGGEDRETQADIAAWRGLGGRS